MAEEHSPTLQCVALGERSAAVDLVCHSHTTVLKGRMLHGFSNLYSTCCCPHAVLAAYDSKNRFLNLLSARPSQVVNDGCLDKLIGFFFCANATWSAQIITVGPVLLNAARRCADYQPPALLPCPSGGILSVSANDSITFFKQATSAAQLLGAVNGSANGSNGAAAAGQGGAGTAAPVPVKVTPQASTTAAAAVGPPVLGPASTQVAPGMAAAQNGRRMRRKLVGISHWQQQDTGPG